MNNVGKQEKISSPVLKLAIDDHRYSQDQAEQSEGDEEQIEYEVEGKDGESDVSYQNVPVILSSSKEALIKKRLQVEKGTRREVQNSNRVQRAVDFDSQAEFEQYERELQKVIQTVDRDQESSEDADPDNQEYRQRLRLLKFKDKDAASNEKIQRFARRVEKVGADKRGRDRTESRER